MHQRLDVLDQHNKWLEATVVDLNEDWIKVHFKGFTPRWDEYISFKDLHKVREVGALSKAHGWAKTNAEY